MEEKTHAACNSNPGKQLVFGFQRRNNRIPRANLIKRASLRIFGTALSATPTPTREENNPMSLISNLSFTANGSLVVKNMSFQNSYYGDVIQYGTPPDRTQSSATAATSVSIVAHSFLDFHMAEHRALFGVDTYFPAKAFENTTLDITYTTIGTIDTGSSPTLTSAGTRVGLEVETNANGLINESKLGIFKETTQGGVMSVTGENAFQLNVGNWYKGFYLKQRDNTLRNDALSTNIQLNGNEVVQYVKNRWDLLQSAMKLDRSIETQITGVNYIDMVKLTSAPLDARKLSSLKLVADTVSTAPTTTADLNIIGEEIITPGG